MDVNAECYIAAGIYSHRYVEVDKCQGGASLSKPEPQKGTHKTQTKSSGKGMRERRDSEERKK